MDRHSLKILEFDKLKENLAEYAYIDKTKAKILELEPLEDFASVKRELELTLQFFEFLKYDGGLELSGIRDIKHLIEKIELIGTYLYPEDLNILKKNMRVFRLAKGKIEEVGDKYRNLYTKVKDIPTYKGIEDLIEKAVDESGEITDEASPDIRDIRRHKRNIADNIKHKFDDIMNSPTYAKAIQERIITIRDGRSVIPIKADFKGVIKGIEHDRSSSGQTVFIEPLSIVSLNNKMRELEVREREETRKILLRMTDMVRLNKDGLIALSEAILTLDILYAKATYAIENNCNKPVILEKEVLKFVNARHPFIPKDEVVPLSFELGKDYDIMLITGPNTGGKTVALKTAGLLSLMALSGMLIPADEKTEIGMFSGIYADIGDEQSIEQNLSSFSAHLKNVQVILENVNKGSLVLLDELGSGTDPMEGSAFAMAVIDYLKEKKVKSIISTHYSEVKAYGYNEQGVESASMEFNSDTLSPTYRLLLGIPGESNALKIAKRLGLSEKIIERAEKYISEEDKKVENMILSIKEKSARLEEMEIEVERLKEQARIFKEEYEDKLRNIEKEKNDIIKEAYEKSDFVVKEAQAKAKALIEKIKKEDSKKEELKATEKSLNMLRQAMREEKNQNIVQEKKVIKNLDIKKGETVYITSLTGEATVLKVDKSKGTAQVQAGILKLVVSFDDIKKIEKKKLKPQISAVSAKRSGAKSKIDLRGKMVDDAIHELEEYLDRAMLSGYHEVQIVHGKGTGALRKGIQNFLKVSRYVNSFRDANQDEGGLGCTVVELK
jgi:DNA mismatch repair protein MutS2